MTTESQETPDLLGALESSFAALGRSVERHRPVVQEPPAPTRCACGAQETADSVQVNGVMHRLYGYCYPCDLHGRDMPAPSSAQEPADPPPEWIECGHLNPASAFPGESFCANRKGHAGNHNSRWGTTWPAPDRMQQLAQPIVVFGNLGWRNPTPPGNGTQFQVYGPGGRWAKGDCSIEDALIAAGAREGDRLIVVAVDRYADAAAVEATIRGAL